MATTIRTCDGDILDTLCQAHYGHLNGCVAMVLEANRGLAAERQPYRGGVVIELPDLPAPTREVVTLWE
ncbi:tail protein X [Microvirgula curvata]|uniref:Phage tail protein n=1 Tax=Microvirgula aerodenitrificans TaxID=57480 RepID=A0A2S0PE82_9NEIS|nr:tail protein X [Microvirgula aerodenitrificans]AVY95689.1 phage tail protein [Microvirgula aerodenitrificans]